MSLYTYFIPTVAVLVALGCCALKFMHYFQLNSYKSAEHSAFARRNISLYILSVCYALAVLPAIFVGYFAPLYVILISISFSVSYKPKSYLIAKKPLVLTPRVKRMLTTEAVIVTAIGTLAFIFLPYRFLPLAVSVGFLLCPYLCSLANLINFPIESAVRRHYTKEAVSLLRGHPSLKVVGITGSYGKTGTKYYLSTILSERYNVLMTPGSFNTPLGVVKTVRESLRSTTEVFVCEMGAKYVGDIKELCELTEPSLGILTSIAPQHLETFGSLERIVKTKLELCDCISARDGETIVNLDSQLIKENLPDGVITCGRDSDSQFMITKVRADRNGTAFELTVGEDTSIPISTPLLGAHNVTNVALASIAALRLGVTPEQIRKGAAKLRSAPHRLELIRRGKDIIIDDSYNSNPLGSEAALEALSLFSEYKILITPGMVELGDKSEYYNYSFGAKAAKVCNSIILVGKKQTEPIHKGILDTGFDGSRLHVCERVEEAIRLAETLSNDPKVMLLENDLPDNYR